MLGFVCTSQDDVIQEGKNLPGHTFIEKQEQGCSPGQTHSPSFPKERSVAFDTDAEGLNAGCPFKEWNECVTQEHSSSCF